MENLRLPLWAGFFVVAWLLISQWSADYAIKTDQTAKITAQTRQNIPKEQASKPALELSNSLPAISNELSNGPSVVQETKQKLDLVVVTTDVMEVSINTKKGADIIQAKLLNYYPSKKKQNPKHRAFILWGRQLSLSSNRAVVAEWATRAQSPRSFCFQQDQARLYKRPTRSPKSFF